MWRGMLPNVMTGHPKMTQLESMVLCLCIAKPRCKLSLVYLTLTWSLRSGNVFHFVETFCGAKRSTHLGEVPN